MSSITDIVDQTASMSVESLSEDVQSAISRDHNKFFSLMRDLKTCTSEIKNNIQQLKSRATDCPTSKGVSLLDVKSQTMLSYISSLTYLMLLKAQGKPIDNHPVIDHLCEQRVVLEKIRPLENKLRYQLDKLIRISKLAEDKTSHLTYDQQDPLAFKPNLSALSDSEGEEQDTKGKKKQTQKNKQDDDEETGVYRPPKIAPAYFEETGPATKDKLATSGKLSARTKDRASKSRVIRDLMKEYDERPEEAGVAGTGIDMMDVRNADKNVEDLMNKTSYEEDNFTRLPTTRRDKLTMKSLKTRTWMATDELGNLRRDFSDIAGLNNAVKNTELQTMGAGVLGKKNKRARDFFQGGDEDGGDANKRRKGKGAFKSAEDLVERIGKSASSQAGGGVFTKKVRTFKKQMQKKSAKQRKRGTSS